MDDKFRVMITDDEYIVREDLKSLIDWEALGFTIVCEANNGKQGLELATKYRPEIIIADIKMPVMDGLTMAGEILTAGLDAEFILLTAYDEFDFARKAMKMQISHYLLKHEIDSGILLGLLEEIRPKAELKRRHKKDEFKNGVKSLLLGGIQQKINMPGCCCTILLVPNTVNIWSFQCKQEFLKLVQIMDDGEYYVLAASCSQISEMFYRSSITGLAKAMSAELKTVVQIGRKAENAGELYKSYISGRDCFSLAAFTPEGCGVLLPELKADLEIDRASAAACVSALRDSLLNKSAESFEKTLRDYVEGQCAAKKRGAQFQFARPLFAGVLGEYNEINNLIPAEELEHLYGIKNAGLFLEESCSIARRLISAKEVGLSVNMRKVLRLIDSSYGKDISLEDIGTVLGVNPIYAGQLFKKEIGTSFKQYLSEKRIEQAKLLLESGKYKIYEVGEMVGYQTTQYFCNIFKKLTGKSPSDYTK